MQKTANNPLKTIKITPLAAESFGVRSMCTLVETPDVTLLLDAGVSLCPYRFNLPPHPLEYQTIQHLRQTIAEAADKAQVVTISHYHFDHHTPSYTDWVVNWTDDGETARQIYQNKIVLAKNPKTNINASQRQRAYLFGKTGAKHARQLEAADGKTYPFGDTSVRFSEAVPHGAESAMLGWVIMATIETADERFMFAPDVQGPMSTHTADLILEAQPSVLMLGGPPMYLGGYRVEQADLERGLANLQRIVSLVPVVVLEHHALRDEVWRPKLEAVFEAAESVGHQVVTAAEFAGQENRFLESHRRQLFHDYPVSDEFKAWTKTLTAKTISKPPI